jgi:hypothetical protein
MTTKPRTTAVTMDMGVPVSVKNVSISPLGEITMFGENGISLQHASATVERLYERHKGPKILSRVPLPQQAPLAVDSNIALLHFDTIFAIDSNSRTINGRIVSVAAVTLCKWSQRDPLPIISFATINAMEFRDIDCHPDLLALKHFLIRLSKNPDTMAAGRIGIVIDSHLGDLHKIETREIPLLDDYFLPAWVSIIYASDAANDRLPNRLLRESDKAADNLLRQIECGDWREDSQEPFSDHGSYFRIWDLKRKTTENH